MYVRRAGHWTPPGGLRAPVRTRVESALIPRIAWHASVERLRSSAQLQAKGATQPRTIDRVVRLDVVHLTFSQSLCTSDSASCLQVIKLSIQPSSVGMVVGSVGGAGAISVGTRPTSSILVSMLLAVWARAMMGARNGRAVRTGGRGGWGCGGGQLKAVGGNDVRFWVGEGEGVDGSRL